MTEIARPIAERCARFADKDDAFWQIADVTAGAGRVRSAPAGAAALNYLPISSTADSAERRALGAVGDGDAQRVRGVVLAALSP